MSKAFLLSCFACDPNSGSEPYVGWNWASEVYAGQRRVVLTRRHHLEALRGRGDAYLSFRFFDLPGFASLDHRHRLMKLYYLVWQVCVLPYAALIVARERLTHVHHITYNAVDFPGLLWIIPFTRFLWGPAGGGQTPPEALAAYYGEAWAGQRWRAWMKEALPFNPFVRLGLRRARIVLAANRETEARLAALTQPGKVRRMLETAVDAAAIAPGPRRPHAPLRVIWVGRFESRKAPRLLIDIARHLMDAHPGLFRFVMVGGGPLLDEARAAAVDLPNIDILGELPFAEMRAAYDAADVLAFTSLQDTSGNVVLEALSAGMPVVALDHQGAAEILAQGGGILVPVQPPAGTVADFSEALRRLTNPDLFHEVSAMALQNMAETCSWQRKAAEWRRLLEEIDRCQRSG